MIKRKCRYARDSRRGYWIKCERYDPLSPICNNNRKAKKECIEIYAEMREGEKDIIREKNRFWRWWARTKLRLSNPSDPDSSISVTDKQEVRSQDYE